MITQQAQYCSFSLRHGRHRLLVVGLLACVLANHAVDAAQAPTEDSLWYYEIGGAGARIGPSQSVGGFGHLGGSAQLGLGFSCGKFDPVAAVTHTLNNIAAGVDNMMNAMTAAASAAIASLPALILQRANPGLYDLFQNALLKAEATLQLQPSRASRWRPRLPRARIPMPT